MDAELTSGVYYLWRKPSQESSQQKTMEDLTITDWEIYSDKDVMEPLDNAEALHRIQPDGGYPFHMGVVYKFIEKHFNRCMVEYERAV